MQVVQIFWNAFMTEVMITAFLFDAEGDDDEPVSPIRMIILAVIGAGTLVAMAMLNRARPRPPLLWSPRAALPHLALGLDAPPLAAPSRASCPRRAAGAIFRWGNRGRRFKRGERELKRAHRKLTKQPVKVDKAAPPKQNCAPRPTARSGPRTS